MKKLPIKTNQELAAEVYADRIHAHLKEATVSWKGVADVFSEAASEFGFGSAEMKYLSKITKFSKSKISKLIAIKESERLKKHSDVFEAVEAWTTLYEVTRLSDPNFNALVQRIAPGEVITMGDIHAVKPTAKTGSGSYKTVLSIQVDVNAMKAMRIQEEFLEAVHTLQNKFDYVHVEEQSILANNRKRFEAEICREYDKLARRAWRLAKKKYLANNKYIDEVTRAELNEDAQADIDSGEYERVFEIIGSDIFDQPKLIKQAASNVIAQREKKYGDKVVTQHASIDKLDEVAFEPSRQSSRKKKLNFNEFE